MEMDNEDRLFIREVGKKAVRVLKNRNIRLWNEFKKRCEENSESPDTVLGTYIWRFAKSIVDEDGEFAEELLSKTIKLSALSRRDDLLKSLDEIVMIKKKLETAESSSIDRLIERLIESEIAKTVVTPMDMLKETKQENRIVIDENVLATLPPDQLEALEAMINKVKEEKVKATVSDVDELEEVLDDEKEEEEEYRYSGGSEDDNRSSEGIEEPSEGD